MNQSCFNQTNETRPLPLPLPLLLPLLLLLLPLLLLILLLLRRLIITTTTTAATTTPTTTTKTTTATTTNDHNRYCWAGRSKLTQALMSQPGTSSSSHHLYHRHLIATITIRHCGSRRFYLHTTKAAGGNSCCDGSLGCRNGVGRPHRLWQSLKNNPPQKPDPKRGCSRPVRATQMSSRRGVAKRSRYTTLPTRDGQPKRSEQGSCSHRGISDGRDANGRRPR